MARRPSDSAIAEVKAMIPDLVSKTFIPLIQSVLVKRMSQCLDVIVAELGAEDAEVAVLRERTERAEAELASLRARIDGAPVIRFDENSYGGYWINSSETVLDPDTAMQYRLVVEP